MLVAGNTSLEILTKMLARLDLRNTTIITIYYGADTDQTEAEEVNASIRQMYPNLQVEVVKGGQPYYNYIISIE